MTAEETMNIDTTTETDTNANESPDIDSAAKVTAEESAETPSKEETATFNAPIMTTSAKRRPPYKYDPNRITLRFIFANRDGLAVTIECDPSDTVGGVKALLLSVWPKGEFAGEEWSARAASEHWVSTNN